jgi:hypothetical protein
LIAPSHDFPPAVSVGAALLRLCKVVDMPDWQCPQAFARP